MSLPVSHEDPRGQPAAAELARLRMRLAEYERRSEEQRTIAAAAAHELMVPLIAIEGHAVQLSERLGGSDDEGARTDVEAVLRATTRMRVVVETLLQRARSEWRPLKRTRVQLGELVDDCIALLGREIAARKAEVVVGPMPAVNADGGLLASVLQNLILNGLRYGPREQGVIRVSAVRTDDGWRIAVDSEGRPIAAADRSRVFEAFWRGEAERRAHGCGLGLAICRIIVEEHGGTLGVEPLERGNRFFFTLAD